MVQTWLGPLSVFLHFFSDFQTLLYFDSDFQMSMLSTEFIDACARDLGAKRLHVHMFWEHSQFETLLTKKTRPIIRAPDWVDAPIPAVASQDLISRPTRLNKFNMKRHMSEVSWVASEDHRLNLALQCWKVIVLDSTSHTALGRLLIQCIEHGKSEDYIWQVVSDAFSNKATATLKARASSLLAFGRWKRTTAVGNSDGVFPIDEQMAYDYLCELRYMKAAPSKGKRFLEAVGFSKGLLGAQVDEVLSSARVKGAASGSASMPPKKKHPFSVEQLLILERIAMFATGQDAIFAGYICFLVHCRLRWSDGQHCIQEPKIDLNGDDRGFIEAALYHHKTARKRRSNVVRLLPVAGVLPGVSGYNWAERWLQNRCQMNLRGSLKQPMMPAPTVDGAWTLQPLTSSEANVWLREILAPWSKTKISELATHSAKATVLSWLAKANVEISLRRLAGYHVTPGDKSALEYSRDAAAPVLRQIEAVSISLRAELFKPDAPRSQRWPEAESLEEAVKLAATRFDNLGHKRRKRRVFKASLLSLEARPEEGTGPDSCMQEPSEPAFGDETTLEDLKLHALKRQSFLDQIDVDAASDMSELSGSLESSTDSDSGSDDADRQAEMNAERNASNLVAPSDLAGKVCYRHVKSRKMHFVEKTSFDVKIFRCGRKCNENYERLATVPAFAARGCMMCFGWSDKADEAASDPED